ncbi:hypothetical protein TIFTF001_009732 [Ficus carica]|uniref:DNA N(6)-methyladenine demethylase n=1 Tax=Ficus carica TaxID=3494 RepID=A0AA88AHN1_FICCA|nr:hypothetical protein TIFTF001_009732 [Ficus carica]
MVGSIPVFLSSNKLPKNKEGSASSSPQQSDKISGEKRHDNSDFLYKKDEFPLLTRFRKNDKPVHGMKHPHYEAAKNSTTSLDSPNKSCFHEVQSTTFDICLSDRSINCSYVVRREANLAARNYEFWRSEWDQRLEGSCGRVLRPGMVILKHYLTFDEQVNIVKRCRNLGIGPGGFYQPGYKDGAKLRLRMMCLGLDWDPQTRKYADRRPIDGSRPPCIPREFSQLVERSIRDAHSQIKKESGVNRNAEEVLPSMSPNICIVNFYTTSGRLGLHQDRDESRESIKKGLPVVSISVGDSAEFLYGDQRDVDKAEKVILDSGDVLIFGGQSRQIFHGVASIIPNSAPKELSKQVGLRPGRLNLTFRKY